VACHAQRTESKRRASATQGFWRAGETHFLASVTRGAGVSRPRNREAARARSMTECGLQGEGRSEAPLLRAHRVEDLSRCARHNPFRCRKGAKPKASASGEPGVQRACPLAQGSGDGASPRQDFCNLRQVLGSDNGQRGLDGPARPASSKRWLGYLRAARVFMARRPRLSASGGEGGRWG